MEKQRLLSMVWRRLSSRLTHLLAEFENYELGRLERCKTDQDVHYTGVDILLSGRTAVTGDKEASSGVLPWKAPARNWVSMKARNVKPEAGPERLVVRFETAH